MPGPSRPPAGVAVARGRGPLSVAVAALLGLVLPAAAEAPVPPLPPGPPAPGDEAGGAQSPVQAEEALPPRSSPLGNRWAIGVSDVVFDMRPHHPTYILPAIYTDRVNVFPGSPNRPAPATARSRPPGVSRSPDGCAATCRSSAATARAWSTTTGNRAPSASASRSPTGSERSAGR